MEVNVYPWLQTLVREFAATLQEGRLPGSVIIAGRDDDGVMDAAAYCAQLFLCHQPQAGQACGQCRSCRLWAGGSHPDLIGVLPTTADEMQAGADLTPEWGALLRDFKSSTQKRSIRIDSLRRMQHLVNESSVAGHGKVVIIRDAQLMSESAANSVLKTFEEPPRDTLIIMAVDSLSLLLPTILSRAFKLQIKPASLPEALAYLNTKAQVDVLRAAAALALAQGAPLGAWRLIQSGQDAEVIKALQALSAAAEGKAPAGNAVALLQQLPSDLQLSCLSETVLELLKYKAGAAGNSLPLIQAGSLERLVNLSADNLLEAWHLLCRYKSDLKQMPARAPQALWRSWINALTAGRQR